MTPTNTPTSKCCDKCAIEHITYLEGVPRQTTFSCESKDCKCHTKTSIDIASLPKVKDLKYSEIPFIAPSHTPTTDSKNSSAIQRFVEKAIKGGWRLLEDVPVSFETYGGISTENKFVFFDGTYTYRTLAEVLLDPEAWKAVGKVEGWPDYYGQCRHDGRCTSRCDESNEPSAYINAVQMLGALWEGKNIEEYLETIV